MRLDKVDEAVGGGVVRGGVAVRLQLSLDDLGELLAQLNAVGVKQDTAGLFLAAGG